MTPQIEHNDDHSIHVISVPGMILEEYNMYLLSLAEDDFVSDTESIEDPGAASIQR
jgi:hypothetical protein